MQESVKDAPVCSKQNLLITLDHNYIAPAKVMLFSLLLHNPNRAIDLYILHSSLTPEDIGQIQAVFDCFSCEESRRVIPISIQDDMLAGAPVTDRYPREMYYRIFAARYLPEELDRVLYLDPDLIVNGSLDTLCQTPLEENFYAAASHVKEPMRKINALRLGMEKDGPYINSGVLLINLPLLREQQDYEQVFHYVDKNKNRLLLPDQDVLSGLYSARILPLDPYRYNMTERLFVLRPESDAWLDLDWVRRNSTIIHYCGRNKPWKENYLGKLDVFYMQAARQLSERSKL